MMKVVSYLPAEILGQDDKKSVKQRMEEYLYSAHQKQENKKFEKVKQNLFESAINSDPELKQYYKDLKYLKNTSRIDAPSDKELLQEKRNVWRGAVATERSDRRNLIFSTGTGILSLLGFIGLSVATSGLISVASFVLGSVPLLITISKYKNRQKFNKADSTAKGRDYEKLLEKFTKSAEKYKETIDSNKDLIMDAQKNMPHKEFKKFMADFREDTLGILNINSETFIEQKPEEKVDVDLESQINVQDVTKDDSPEMGV